MQRTLARLLVLICTLATLTIAAPAHAQLTAPTLTATSISRSEIDLSWTTVTNAVSYNVYSGTTPGGEVLLTNVMAPMTTYHNSTGLSSSKPYYYQVAAVDSMNNIGPRSTETEAVTSPTGVHATAGDAEVALTWNLSGTSGVTYNVYRASGGGYTKITSSPVTTASYLDASASLVNQTAYTYEITALFSGIESALSSPTTAVTPALQINAGGPALTSSGASTTLADLVVGQALEFAGGVVARTPLGRSIGQYARGVADTLFKRNCFVAGTPVQMADGSSKKIEGVREGDLVLSRNPDTGVTEAKAVLAHSVKIAPQVLTLTLVDSVTHLTQSITCTPGHPFYVQGQGFVLAGSLGIGTSIVTRAGPCLAVSAVRYEPKSTGGVLVYNFTVEGDHTYFVGT